MKIKLDCSKKYINDVTEKFTKAGIQIDDNGVLMIVDNPMHSFRKKEPFDDYKSIIFIESYGNKIHIHQSHEEDPIIINEKLYELEDRYKEHGFVRVNKSQIVNIRFIKDIDPWIGQKYILTMNNKNTIYVNRTYYQNFKLYLNL